MVVATNPKRYCHRHANYAGDLTDGKSDLFVGKVMGPNALNEMMTVLKIEYNPETDTTRVGFDFTRQTDFTEFTLEGVEVLDAD